MYTSLWSVNSLAVTGAHKVGACYILLGLFLNRIYCGRSTILPGMAVALWQQASISVADFWPVARPTAIPSLSTTNLDAELLDTAQIPFKTSEQHTPIPPSCPHAQISCQNTSVVEDLCCFNAPGGQILMTQFWDTKPPLGPEDEWGAHGAWPDRCDGTFEQFCDSSRHYSNISEILEKAGETELLADMHKYWKDYKGHDNSFWAHEFNKHGQCVSTLRPSCYSDYVPQTEVVDYFKKAIELYKTLPSFRWLAEAGITPGPEKRFARADIEAALEKHHGYPPTIRCRYGQLNEIWYHFDVRGSFQTGDFLPTLPDGPKGNCPAEGIRYLPKVRKPRPGPGHPPLPPPGSRQPFTGRGLLKVHTNGHEKGCIISSGQWYSSGTCATFLASQVAAGGFTLRSRKGHCAIAKGAIKCAANIRKAVVFGNTIASDGAAMLTHDGQSSFWANKVPRGFKKVDVHVREGDLEHELEIIWQPI